MCSSDLVLGGLGLSGDCDRVVFYSGSREYARAAAAGDPDGDGGLDVSVGYYEDPFRMYLFAARDLPWTGSVTADLAWDSVALSGFETSPLLPVDLDEDGAGDLLRFDMREADDGTRTYVAELYLGG